MNRHQSIVFVKSASDNHRSVSQANDVARAEARSHINLALTIVQTVAVFRVFSDSTQIYYALILRE